MYLDIDQLENVISINFIFFMLITRRKRIIASVLCLHVATLVLDSCLFLRDSFS
jgi:hypothetical protein